MSELVQDFVFINQEWHGVKAICRKVKTGGVPVYSRTTRSVYTVNLLNIDLTNNAMIDRGSVPKWYNDRWLSYMKKEKKLILCLNESHFFD